MDIPTVAAFFKRKFETPKHAAAPPPKASPRRALLELPAAMHMGPADAMQTPSKCVSRYLSPMRKNARTQTRNAFKGRTAVIGPASLGSLAKAIDKMSVPTALKKAAPTENFASWIETWTPPS